MGETEFKGEMGFLAVDAEDNLFVAPRELWGANKLIMVSMETNQSSIIIDNAGQAPLNQPCVIDHGNGLVIPRTRTTLTGWFIRQTSGNPRGVTIWLPKGRMPTK